MPPPVGGVYRLGQRSANWFAPPDWAYVHDDGTFGNRFDDPSAATGVPPEGRFRAIYCATQRAATFGETIARFRPSLRLLADLAEIDDDEPIAESLAGAVDPQDPRRGVVRADWRHHRRVDHTVLVPDLAFVDITAAETLQHLRVALAPMAERLGLADVDLSAVTSPQRLLTQHCARYIYDQRATSSRPRFAGIRYVSRLNPAWECWAIFDDVPLEELDRRPIAAEMPAFQRVAKLFGLTVY